MSFKIEENTLIPAYTGVHAPAPTEAKGDTVIVTGMFDKGAEAPKSLNVDGHELVLQDVAYGIGLNEKDEVMFKKESSGEVLPLGVAVATYEAIKNRVKPCRHEGCLNCVLPEKKCWAGHL